MHDAPHRAEQADVRRDRADGREERQVRFDGVELTLEARTHGAPGAVEQGAGVGHSALAQLHEFAHSRREDAFHRRAVGALGGVCIELVEVLADPELALEFFVRGTSALQAEELAEDHGPAGQRGDHQPRHHQLHHDACVQHERDDREVLVHSLFLSRERVIEIGTRCGRKVPAFTQAMRIVPSASSVLPPACERHACCVIVICARPACLM